MSPGFCAWWLCIVHSGEIDGGRALLGRVFALPRDAGRRPALHVRIGVRRRVVGAGFALTRDAGRRPALQRCRSEAGASSDAGRRPALHVGLAWGVGSLERVSRSRAMPVGDQRSSDAGRRAPVRRDPRLSSRARENGVNRRGEERSSTGDVGPVLDHLLPPAAVGGKQRLCRLPVRLQQVYETGVEILL